MKNNNLEGCLAETHPEIAAQWDWEKNKGLLNKNGEQITPYNITAGFNKKVNWKLDYDAPMDDPYPWRRGKHYEFKWSASPNNRTSKNLGCPYLAKFNAKVWQGYNDLASTNPELVPQFDWIRNKGILNRDGEQITPYNITAGCTQKVYWKQDYIVPMNDQYPWRRGKHYEFKWSASPNNRTSKNQGCPFLSGRKVWQGYNDLASTHPKLVLQWDWIRNKGLLNENGEQITPYNITAGSKQRVNWILHYDVPMDDIYPWRRGKHYDFLWNASIQDRTYKNADCPFLTGDKVQQGYNDLASTHPELVPQWDWVRNKGILNKDGEQITPYNITASSNYHVNWILHYDVPMDDQYSWRRGKHFEFLWNVTPNSRTSMATSCPFLSGRKVQRGYNDLASTHPKIAAQFDWIRNKGILNKNGEQITPYNITANCSQNINWIYILPNNKCIKWQSTPYSRIQSTYECPELSKHLRTSFPEQAIYYYIKQIYPDAINGYKDIFTHTMELDIYIPSLKIGIEYDGEAWHNNEVSFEREIRKYAICAEHGITLIRIKENKNHNGDDICDVCLHTKKNLNATIEQLRKYINLPNNIDTDKDSELIKEQYLYVA